MRIGNTFIGIDDGLFVSNGVQKIHRDDDDPTKLVFSPSIVPIFKGAVTNKNEPSRKTTSSNASLTNIEDHVNKGLTVVKKDQA